MTLSEIKQMVMFQTNNDAEDLGDFEPYLCDYINEGYDRLVKAWAKVHVSFHSEDYPRLEEDGDTPATPEWTHRYLADWATWLIYRNGNPQKQQRGYQYQSSFMQMIATISDEGGADGLDENGNQKVYRHFINIPD